MKITDGEVITNGERELIDAITADLDWGAIEKIFKEKHRIQMVHNGSRCNIEK